MKTGRNIEELGKELLRQRQIRKDFVADTVRVRIKQPQSVRQN